LNRPKMQPNKCKTGNQGGSTLQQHPTPKQPHPIRLSAYSSAVKFLYLEIND